MTIKASLGRDAFAMDAGRLRRGLAEHDPEELPVTAAHAVAVAALPPHRRDPFDRMLVARAQGEAPITADPAVGLYGGRCGWSRAAGRS